MALTKAAPPVTDITEMAFGTTKVEITSSAGPIDVDIAGLNVVDITTTAITLDDLVTLVANTMTGEDILLSTPGGATASLKTAAGLAQLLTTSLHPLILGSNSVQNLICATDGRVTLDTTGNASGQLVDKAYVDTGDGGVTQTQFPATLAKPGHIQIPNAAGTNLIINWGETAVLNNATEVVTFNQAYASAVFVGFATRNSNSSSDNSAAHTGVFTLTTMEVTSAGDGTTVFWVAIGF